MNEVPEEFYELTSSTRDLTLRISEDNDLTRKIWNITTTLSFPLKEITSGQRSSKQCPQRSRTSDFHQYLQLLHSFKSLKDTRHPQLNRVERNVEFVLAPQHETSCDSEIQTKKDFKSKFRIQLGSSPTTSWNSEDKEEILECLKSRTKPNKNEDGHWISKHLVYKTIVLYLFELLCTCVPHVIASHI